MNPSSLSAVLLFTGRELRRSAVTVAFVALVGWVLGTHLLGFWTDAVSLRRTMGAIGLSIFLGGVFFIGLHPDNENVSVPMCVSAVVLGAAVWAIAQLHAVDHPFVPMTLKLLVSVIAVLVVGVWAWYGVVELDGYSEPFESLVEAVPEPLDEALAAVLEPLHLLREDYEVDKDDGEDGK